MNKNNLKVVKSDSKKEQESKEKKKSLEAAISQIDQNFGKGSVMRLGQQQALDIESISTGSLSLDLVTFSELSSFSQLSWEAGAGKSLARRCPGFGSQQVRALYV